MQSKYSFVGIKEVISSVYRYGWRGMYRRVEGNVHIILRVKGFWGMGFGEGHRDWKGVLPVHLGPVGSRKGNRDI